MHGPKENLVERLLHRVADAVCRHPRWFIIPQIALMFACVYYTVTNLEFSTDRDALVSADKKYHQIWLQFKKEFPSLDDLVVIVESGTREKNRQFVERLAAKVQAETNLFKNVFYKGDLTQLGPKALLFLPEDTLGELDKTIRDYSPFIQSFSQATNLNSLFRLVNHQFRAAAKEQGTNSIALVDALPALRRIVEQATDSLNRPGVPPSPGITALFDAGHEAEQSEYITFAKGKIYIVTAHAVEEKLETDAVERMRELVRETEGEVPGVNAGITGQPVLQYDEMYQAQYDTTVAALVALCLVAVIFIFGYKETGRPLKATLCLLFGISYTMGFTTLTIGHLNILTITFVPILIGLAIDFGVHLITRFEEELRGGEDDHTAMRRAMVHAGSGIFTGAFTTAGALLAMAFTEFRGIQEMGYIAGFGLLICLIPMMTVLPVLLLRGRQNVLDHRLKTSGRRAKIEQVWLQRPKTVVVLGVIFTAVSLTQLRDIYFDYNLLNMQSKDLPAVDWEKKLIDSASKSVLYAAIVADSVEDAVAKEQQLTNLSTVAHVDSMGSLLSENQQGKLETIRGIKRTLADIEFAEVDTEPVNLSELSQTLYSLQGYLGAAVTEVQKRGGNEVIEMNLRSLQDAIRKLRGEMLQGDRDRNSVKLAAFQMALFNDVKNTFDALKNQDASEPLRVEDLPASLRNRFVGVTGKFVLQVYPKKNIWQREAQEEFVRELRTIEPEVTGTPVQLFEYTSLLKESYQEATLYALGAIVILVLLHFRRISCVFLALLPVMVGASWMLGFMGLFDIPFNPANIMTLPLVMGIGVTSGIHILNRFSEEQNPSILAKSTGKAVLVSALTTIAGFGSLIPSKHQGIVSLGEVMSIGVGTCMVAALTFLPAVLNLLTKIGWKIKPPGRQPAPPRESPR